MFGRGSTGVVAVVTVALTGCGPNLIYRAGPEQDSAADDGGDTTDGAAQPTDVGVGPGPTFDGINAGCTNLRDIDDCSLRAQGRCGVGCQLDTPCDPVLCTFSETWGFPSCDEMITPEALTCVFEAIAAGEPMRFDLDIESTSSFSGSDSTQDYWLLSDDLFMEAGNYEYSNDVGDSESGNWLSWGTFAQADLLACSSLPDTAAVECLRETLSSATCEPPAAYVCPVK